MHRMEQQLDQGLGSFPLTLESSGAIPQPGPTDDALCPEGLCKGNYFLIYNKNTKKTTSRLKKVAHKVEFIFGSRSKKDLKQIYNF